MKLLSAFTRKRVLIGLLCLSVVLSFLGPRRAGVVRAAFHWALAPLGDAGMYIVTTVRTHAGPPRRVTEEDLRQLRDELLRRDNQILSLQGELFDLRAQKPVMSRIYGQIPPGEFPFDLIPASVVGISSMPYGHTVRVNAGSKEGGIPGSLVTTRKLMTALPKEPEPPLAALSGSAVVGWLTETWAFGATLQLVTDRGFRIPAEIHRVIDQSNPRQVTIIERGKSRTEPLQPANNAPLPVLAEGDGDGMIVREVNAYHNVLPGDLLATSRSPYLPARIIIGKVRQVSPDGRQPDFVTLRVEPGADLDNLRHVFIVVPLWPGSKL